LSAMDCSSPTPQCLLILFSGRVATNWKLRRRPRLGTTVSMLENG
jgi:hypothetical protein